MKKLLLITTVLLCASTMAFAELTVKETRSPEFLKNEGFSDATIQAIQVKTGEAETRKRNRWRDVGFKIWNYIDPASPQSKDHRYHDIKPYSHFEDL